MIEAQPIRHQPDGLITVRPMKPGGALVGAMNLRGTFGPEIRDLRDCLRNPDRFSEERYEVLREAIDTNFAKFMDEQFPGLNHKELLLDANNVIETVQRTLYPQANPRLLNDLRFPGNSITESNLSSFLAPENVVHEDLKRQLGVQLFIARNCAIVKARSMKYRLPEIAGNINRTLDQNLWVGRRGETKEVIVPGLHNNRTNKIVDRYDGHDFDPNEFHVKEHHYRLRRVRLNGHSPLVLADVREKSLASSVLKALSNAASNADHPGVIDPDSALSDWIGALFAINGGMDEAKKFAQIVKNVIDKKYPVEDAYEKLWPGNGGNRDTEYHRLMVKLRDCPLPVELIVQPWKNHINALCETRIYPEDEGMTGRAHTLYETRRVAGVAELLLREPDVDGKVQHALRYKAGNLRNMEVVAH